MTPVADTRFLEQTHQEDTEGLKRQMGMITKAGSNLGHAVLKSAQDAITLAGSAVPKGLILADHFLDCIPLASTANNAIDLGLKHLVIKDMDPESSSFKEYIQHIQNKESKSCMAFSIPVLGNVWKLGSVVYSLIKKDKEPAVEEEIALPPARDVLESDALIPYRQSQEGFLQLLGVEAVQGIELNGWETHRI